MSGTIESPTTLLIEYPDNTSGLVLPANGRNLIASAFGMLQPRFLVSTTVTAAQWGQTLKMNSATTINVTIPAGVLTAGKSISVRQEGVGQVTFVGTGGVTYASSTGTVTTRAQNSLVTATADPDTANLFWLDGDLT